MTRASRRVQVSDDFDVMHVYDPDAARAALNDVLSVDLDAADKLPWSQQLAIARAVYGSLGAFYRHVNVPPPSDPLYVDSFTRWYAPRYVWTSGGSGAQAIDPADAAWSRLNGIGPSIASSDAKGQLRERIDHMFALLGRVPTTEHIIIRLELDERGRTIEVCTSGRSGDGVCDFGEGTLYIGCQQQGDGREGCTPYGWGTLAWSDDPWPTGYRKLLCPLRWFVEFAIEVAQAIATRSDPFGLPTIEATIAASARYVAVQNLDTIDRWNISPDATVRDLAAAMRAQIPAAQTRAATETSNQVTAAGAAAAGVFAAMAAAAGATASSGPWGAALGAVILIVALLFRYVLPVAVGAVTDRFGRQLPVILVATIPDAPSSDPERSIHSRSTLGTGPVLPTNVSSTLQGRASRPAPTPVRTPTLTILPDRPPASSGPSPLVWLAALALLAAASKRR